MFYKFEACYNLKVARKGGLMRALITGASSGIGRELAIQLSRLNYDLILVARRLDRLTELKNSLTHTEVIIKQVDLSNDKQLKQLMTDLETLDIDLFINNAGFGKIAYSSKIETQSELDIIHLNINVLHQLNKFAIKHMKQGKIVNISSLASFLPTPNLATYAASKSYVTSYSQALNYELEIQDIPIKVLTVCPGPVESEFSIVAGGRQKLKGMPVEKCCKIIIKGIGKNKSLIIPGLKMKLLRFFLRFIPTRLILSVSNRIQTKK